MTKQHGSCHCGAVTFEATLDLSVGSRCNCSICTKTMWTGVLIKPDAFHLLSGEDALGTYEWGYKISKRYFCKHCGVHCFARGHLEEVGGDYVSINANVLDGVEVHMLPLRHWDGRHDNWEGGVRPQPWPIQGGISG